MKKNALKKIIAVALILAVCLSGLAGCKKNDDNAVAETPEFVYIPEYFSIDGAVRDINRVAYYDGVVYFTTWEYLESEGDIVMPPLPQPFDSRVVENDEDTGVQEDVDETEPAQEEPASPQDSTEPSVKVLSSTNVRIRPGGFGGGGAIAVPAPTSAPVEEKEEVEDDTDDADAEAEDTDTEESADVPVTDDIIMDYPMYTRGREITKLFKVNIDGTSLEELTNFKQTEIPEDKLGSSDIRNMTIDGDGNIWIEEQVYSYLMDEDYNYSEEKSEMFLRKLDGTGTEVSRIDMSFITSKPNTYIQSMQIDNDGNVYFTVYSMTEDYSTQTHSIIVIDANGKELMNIEHDTWLDQLVKLGDGRIGIPMYDQENQKQVFQFVDLEKRDWGDKIALPGNIPLYNSMPGNDEYDLFYNDNANLCGVNFNEEGIVSTQILNWIDSDISSDNLSVTAPLPDGKVLCILRMWDRETGESSTEFALLTKRPYSDRPEREIITLAAMYIDYDMRADIIKFNKTSDKYRISVTEYGQYIDYEVENSYNQILTRFNTEIISGKTPDIILLDSSMPVKQYAAKGLLADLYEFIEDDPELNREDFVESVMKILEHDGKLIQMISSFMVSTYIGRVDILGPEKGITLEELMDAVEANPGSRPFDFYYTKENILADCISMNMDSFINWTTGKCSFNTPEFAKILEFSNQFMESFDWESMEGEYPDESADFRDGTQLLRRMWMSDFLSFMYNKQEFGDQEVVFKGFPSESRDGHIMQMNSNSFAITTKCKNREGAWEFLRQYLTEKYQMSDYMWNYPVSKKALEKMAEKAMTEQYYENPVTGERIKQVMYTYWEDGNDMPIEIYSMPKEDVEIIMDVINSLTRTQNYDESIVKIVLDEAKPFFAGQKTAEATADIIQNRLSLYVNEQR